MEQEKGVCACVLQTCHKECAKRIALVMLTLALISICYKILAYINLDLCF